MCRGPPRTVYWFAPREYGVRRKRRPKAEAGEVAEQLLDKAVSTAGRDLKLAREQAELARRGMLKFNVRLDWSRKRFDCHGCKRLIVPGVNARVRLAGGGQKGIRLTCLECGHGNRKGIVRTPSFNILHRGSENSLRNRYKW